MGPLGNGPMGPLGPPAHGPKMFIDFQNNFKGLGKEFNLLPIDFQLISESILKNSVKDSMDFLRIWLDFQWISVAWC